MIDSFRGKYFFLSNFYNAPISIHGIAYTNNEAAFQAQKCQNHNDKYRFERLGPSEAKRLGRQINLRPDWEEVKEDAMFAVCLCKFDQNPALKERLLNTGTETLEEGNTWGDREWGAVNGVGNNKLGKVLMELRRIYTVKRTSGGKKK